MSDRYTSPELSRQLAEAGLDQIVGSIWWNENSASSKLTLDRYRYTEGRSYRSFRALDLTGIVTEIRRRMQPSRERILMTDDGETCDVRIESVDVDWMERASGKSLVEAAGLVLLAMLKERRP